MQPDETPAIQPRQSPQPTPPTHPGLVVVIVTLVLLVIAAVVFLTWRMLYGKSQQNSLTYQTQPVTSPVAVNSPSPLAGVTTPSPAVSPSTEPDADLNAVDTDLKTLDASTATAEQGLNDKQTDLSS